MTTKVTQGGIQKLFHLPQNRFILSENCFRLYGAGVYVCEERMRKRERARVGGEREREGMRRRKTESERERERENIVE